MFFNLNYPLTLIICALLSFPWNASASVMFTSQANEIFERMSGGAIPQIKAQIDDYKKMNKANYVGNLDVLYNDVMIQNLKRLRLAIAERSAISDIEASRGYLEDVKSRGLDPETDPALLAIAQAFTKRGHFCLDRTNRHGTDESPLQEGDFTCDRTGITPTVDVTEHERLTQETSNILEQYTNQEKGQRITNGNTRLTIRRITHLVNYDRSNPNQSDTTLERFKALGDRMGSLTNIMADEAAKKEHMQIRNDYIFLYQLSKYDKYVEHNIVSSGLQNYESKCVLRVDIETNFGGGYISTGSVATVLGMNPETGKIDPRSLEYSLFFIEHTMHNDIEPIMAIVYKEWRECMLCPIDFRNKDLSNTQISDFKTDLARMFYGHTVAMPYHRGSEAILKWLLELTAYARGFEIAYPKDFSFRMPLTTQTFDSFVDYFKQKVVLERL